MSLHHPLPKPLRTQLENTVKAARAVAEKAAGAALEQLAVAEARVPEYLNEKQRVLRRKLRSNARALCGSSYQNNSSDSADNTDSALNLQPLMWEVAYEHWHRMLFARFLAENGLLMWEPGAAVSLDDCAALVEDPDPHSNLGAKTQWELAGKLAARMLPQVFKPHSPVFELAFAPEHQRELERLLAALPAEVFQASDSLGWVYQFWQAQRKDDINKSEVKIGAAELPAVTQLFTEPYMVDFLLHNSLGAWWQTRYGQRHPGQPCPVPLTYLRTLEDGTPAAGKFAGWPDTLQSFKLLDPCCGSGHFLVAAFLLLVPMRMAAEGLTAMDAVDLVLQDNLHGLELDARCVEIAVFALALTAWRYPDEDGNPLGVRADMPAPQVACCGLQVAAIAQDWVALIPDTLSNKELVAQELRALHASFMQSPLLGSLLDPARSVKRDMAHSQHGSSFDALRELMEQALARETAGTAPTEGNDDSWNIALNARGLFDAARLLEARYHLVITNVPYLARGKQHDTLKSYCATHYPDAKNDLANVFLERCLELGRDHGQGVVQIVMPQNWLFLTSYKKQRESLLQRVQWNLLARLGAGAFETISGEVVQAVLLTQTRAPAAEGFQLHGVDASAPKNAADKAQRLREGALVAVSQKGQLGNPDCMIRFEAMSDIPLLGEVAASYAGVCTGDYPRFGRNFWEQDELRDIWEFQRSTVDEGVHWGGMSYVLRWEHNDGALRNFVSERLGEKNVGSWIRGHMAWGKLGVSVKLMRHLPISIYAGELFDDNVAVLIPKESVNLNALYAFCESPEFSEEVRKNNQKLALKTQYLLKIPFDLAHWQQVAAERYPDGLPQPYSDDPTQWLFHGHPFPATDPLQVAVARLLGYRWPAEQEAAAAQATEELQAKSASSPYSASASSYQVDSHSTDWATTTQPPQSAGMALSDAARAWIARCALLAEHTDDDGIVCLPSVRGEAPAHDRLLKLLIAAWETAQPGSWKPATLDKLLAEADCAGKGLDTWLRDKFFEQHAKRFHHRPFVWHVWDGLKDGFAALVNYHQLDAKNLDRLIHTYLGDWIRQQEAGVRDGTDGAPLRLSAAQDLKRRLLLIQEGESDGTTGHDIFVRWKPLAEQPIGWTPDLNDGVRLNIRPFMTAEVLRHNKKPKLNITWDKDRGKDVESAPWFGVFGGERINDHHLTRAQKVAAREAKPWC